MPRRIVSLLFPEEPPRLAHALRECLAEGYGKERLRRDVLAGVTVGIVALPLSMALSVASGAPPQHGLYTAIVAGFVIALLGGSRVQVSGPTAAFVVLLAPVANRYGLGGLMLASMFAGAMLVAMGMARLGRLVQFVPFPVVSGFTAGIAIVIAMLQVKDFLGLTVGKLPDHSMERAVAIFAALPSARWQDALVGGSTLAVLLIWPRLTKNLPAPLVALALAAGVAWVAHRLFPSFEVATIGSRFHYDDGGVVRPGIPRLPPMPVAPWSLTGVDGVRLDLSLATIRELSGPAFAIALLGAIESLLSAVAADGMAGTKHEPDAELVAQGIGNLVAPLFGGFAATGAIARTATNIRYGARTPIAAATHSIFVLVAMLALAPALGELPMASLAALLLVIAWNMSDAAHVIRMVRVAPKSDAIVLGVCLTLTVVFDMVISVTVGVMLAALLFMRRMVEVSNAELVGPGKDVSGIRLPPRCVLYRIDGPLFFGAAQQAMKAISEVGREAKAVVFDLEDVPMMDATGLVSFESILGQLERRGGLAMICGLQAQPLGVLEKAGLLKPGFVHLSGSILEAVEYATAWLEEAPETAPPGRVSLRP